LRGLREIRDEVNEALVSSGSEISVLDLICLLVVLGPET
jgi:hypothetical protein